METKALMMMCGAYKDKRIFAVRVEKQNDDWIRTRSWKTTEEDAKREGYDSTPLTGTFGKFDDFPGCPYCKAESF